MCFEFMKKMYPDAKTRAKFKYPSSGLMQLRSIVTYDELRRPTMLDANGEACLLVGPFATNNFCTIILFLNEEQWEINGLNVVMKAGINQFRWKHNDLSVGDFVLDTGRALSG